MKFFVVILAVIGIESIYVGHALANTINVTMFNVDYGGGVIRVYHDSDGNLVTFSEDVKEGDLQFSMELKRNGEVVESADDDKPRDFCEDTPEGRILRGMLLPKGSTSCPVKEGDYNTRNTNAVDINDTEWTQMKKCGLYMGTAIIQEDGQNTLRIEFYFMLKEKGNDCKK